MKRTINLTLAVQLSLGGEYLWNVNFHLLLEIWAKNLCGKYSKKLMDHAKMWHRFV